MNSRERVQAAIRHQQPDKTPVDIGSTPVGGIAAGAYVRLRRALGLDDHPPKVTEPLPGAGRGGGRPARRPGHRYGRVLGCPTTFFGYQATRRLEAAGPCLMEQMFWFRASSPCAPGREWRPADLRQRRHDCAAQRPHAQRTATTSTPSSARRRWTGIISTPGSGPTRCTRC